MTELILNHPDYAGYLIAFLYFIGCFLASLSIKIQRETNPLHGLGNRIIVITFWPVLFFVTFIAYIYLGLKEALR